MCYTRDAARLLIIPLEFFFFNLGQNTTKENDFKMAATSAQYNNRSQLSLQILNFPLNKTDYKMSSDNGQPFRLKLDVLTISRCWLKSKGQTATFL